MEEDPAWSLYASQIALPQSSFAALGFVQLSAKSESTCPSSLELSKFISHIPFSVLLVLVGLFLFFESL